jgi:subtilisin family serine protease
MAAPVVSGLAALIMAYYPELTAADVKRVILESATKYTNRNTTKPGSDDERVPFGTLSASGAVVNAYSALRRAEEIAGSKR